MEIKKISWTPKNGAKVSYELTEGEESVSYVKKSDAVPMLDFQNAINALTPHLCFLTEYTQVFSPTDSDSTFSVTEIQLTGEGEEEKVVLIGRKELKNQLTIPIKTLKTAMYNTGEYEYSGNLAEAVETLVAETKLYLNGKHQDKPVQLKMELSDKEEDNSVEDDL